MAKTNYRMFVSGKMSDNISSSWRYLDVDDISTHESRYTFHCIATHVPIYVVSSKVSRYLGRDTIRVSRSHVSRCIDASMHRYTPTCCYGYLPLWPFTTLWHLSIVRTIFIRSIITVAPTRVLTLCRQVWRVIPNVRASSPAVPATRPSASGR